MIILSNLVSSLSHIYPRATSVEVQLQTDALAKHRTALIKGASKLTMEQPSYKRASKLTMGQSLTVMMSHQVQICLRRQRPPMDDGGQLIKYWATLTDMPEIKLVKL